MGARKEDLWRDRGFGSGSSGGGPMLLGEDAIEMLWMC